MTSSNYQYSPIDLVDTETIKQSLNTFNLSNATDYIKNSFDELKYAFKILHENFTELQTNVNTIIDISKASDERDLAKTNILNTLEKKPFNYKMFKK